MKAIIYTLSLCVLFSCKSNLNSNLENIPVAKVGDAQLYISDLAELIAPNTSTADSTVLVNNYIQIWAKQQLKLQKAKFNLSETEIDIEKQVNDYRNSLIIYAYERQIINQNIDTVIKEAEINSYYKANQQNFELKNNIVKLRFAKTSNLKALDTIKKYITTHHEEELLILDEYAKKNQVNLYYNDSAWQLFTDVLQQVPIQTYNAENFLRNNRYIEIKDQSLHYFVNIIDFKIKESLSPLSYEQERIKNILLNKRKKNLLKRIEDELYKKALESGELEIYDNI